MSQIVGEGNPHKIQPSDVDTAEHFWGAFDHNETEISAKWIVRLCRSRGGWLPFTREEIEAFYSASGRFKNFCFNRLINPGTAFSIRTGPYLAGGGWIVRDGDGLHHVTHDFVDRCLRGSLARKASET
ncbi:MAG: hypothetical protein KBC81_01590 [Candidatus Pacebacteria bacterium]|nr:hypothetical protein [Candidatus Paceibacterota bacterium]